VKYGPCIGGFTQQHWESTEKQVDKKDYNAKLFNITQQLVFPVNTGESDTSIRCSKDSGPEFGIGQLEAWRQPFNKEGACQSWCWLKYGGSYNIGVDS
jgi:hypothetical protein